MIALEEAAVAERRCKGLGAVKARILRGWRPGHSSVFSPFVVPGRDAPLIGKSWGRLRFPQINRSIIMYYMKEIDHLALDGHALELFLAVLEEGSVTAAATRLGLTQSAVSHALNKLRRIAGDPLFVKSGRGIVATAHAQALAAKARTLIDEMRKLCRRRQLRTAPARNCR